MGNSEWLQKVGLSPSDVFTAKIDVKKGESAWLSAQEGVKSVAPVTVRKVYSPEEFKALLVTNPSSVTMMPDGVEGCFVDGVTGAEAAKLKSDRTEAVSFVYGEASSMSEAARDAIVKRYFPLNVSVAALQDVEIHTGGQFVLDSGVANYHFGTVKIHQGGNFVVYSNATIVIDNLLKLPPG